MPNEVIFSVEEAPEGGFTAHALGHLIFTEAESMEELRANIREAVHVHFDEGDRPKIVQIHLVRDEIMAV
jgi:hypothetical protein